MCFPLFSTPRTCSKNVPFVFQRSCAWSSPGRSKPATRRPLRSTRLLWLGKRPHWRFNCLRRTTETERSSESRKVLRVWSRSLQPLKQLMGIFLLQFICRSWGCFVICMCHSQSLCFHDCGCTQATGQQIDIKKWNGCSRFFRSVTSSILVLQVFLEYGFHPRVQRWVIGQCLCIDQRSLASYGVQKDGDTAYVYLISARQARLTRQLFQQDLENALLISPLPPSNSPTSQDWRGYSTLPSRLPHNNQGEFNKRSLSVTGEPVQTWRSPGLTGAVLKVQCSELRIFICKQVL